MTQATVEERIEAAYWRFNALCDDSSQVTRDSFKAAMRAFLNGGLEGDDPSDAIAVRDIVGCSRCGGSHDVVAARRMDRPWAPSEAGGLEWTHWFACPTNGQPVMVIADHKKSTPYEAAVRALRCASMTIAAATPGFHTAEVGALLHPAQFAMVIGSMPEPEYARAVPDIERNRGRVELDIVASGPTRLFVGPDRNHRR